MANISLELVKKLRDRTGVGMMDCKKALEEAGGDLEKAVEILRKKGAAVAAKRAGKETLNGRIAGFTNDDNTAGALVEVACETDFAANTADMKQFVEDAARALLASNLGNIEGESESAVTVAELTSPNGQTVATRLEELIAKISESIKLEKFVRYETDKNGYVATYIHPGSLVGVMVELAAPDCGNRNALGALARNIAMQIAAAKPDFVAKEDIPADVLDKEKEIAREQLKSSGKPENIIEKILEGKIAKFAKEVCLLEQPYIRDDKISVKQYLDEEGKKLGCNISVKRFVRFQIGS